MALEAPTLTQLKKLSVDDLRSRVEGLAASIEKSPEWALAIASAGLAHGVWGGITFALKQVFPSSAAPDFLSKHKELIFDDLKNLPVAMEGLLAVTGTALHVMPSGTKWTRQADGHEWETTADATLQGSGTPVLIAVRSQIPGKEGNWLTGETITIAQETPDVDSQASANAITRSGADAEGVEDGRRRIERWYRARPRGGASGDFVTAALGVPGVTRAWEVRHWDGPGTMLVLIVLDDFDSIFPSADKTKEVKDVLDKAMPSTAVITVAAPARINVDISVSLTPNTVAKRDAITNELKAMFRSDTNAGETLFSSDISSAVGRVGGIRYTISRPVDNIVPLASELPVLGDITYSELSL